MSRLTIAAAQIECRAGDIEANLARHLAVIAEARSSGVDLLVFPELSLTDYSSAPDLPRLARDCAAPELIALAQAAGPMAVSAGFIEAAADGQFYNAQALLAGGRIAAVHRKINLPGYGDLREDRVYAAGSSLTLTDACAGWLAATLICADSWNPALPWLAALGGAEILILPAASSRGAVEAFDNPRGWTVNLAHTALTYGLPVIFANHCGKRDGMDFWGGSRILDSSGRELACAGEEAGLVIATLDRHAGIAARERLPTARTSDPALILDLLSQQMQLASIKTEASASLLPWQISGAF